MADSEETTTTTTVADETTTTSTTVTDTPTEARTPVEQADEASYQASHTVVEHPADSPTLPEVAQTQDERFAQARADALKNHNADQGNTTENSTEEVIA